MCAETDESRSFLVPPRFGPRRKRRPETRGISGKSLQAQRNGETAALKAKPESLTSKREYFMIS
jgi:hypothetical protein